MDEMDTLRIEAELEKQKSTRGGGSRGGNAENRDSGVADVEGGPFQSSTASSPVNESNGGLMGGNGLNGSGGAGSGNGHLPGGGNGGSEQPQQLKRSALSNSLLDMHEQCKCNLKHLRFVLGFNGLSILCFA